MSTTEMRDPPATGLCQEVEESLTSLLDGSASARLFDHVAECDACRDLKHEAGVVMGRVRDAGADFHPAADFLDTLLGKLEAARPVSSGPKASSRIDAGASQGSGHDGGSASKPPGVIVHTEVIGSGGETAATVFDPLAAAKVAEADAESRRNPAFTQPSLDAVPAPAVLPAAPSTRDTAPAPSGVTATTHHGPITQPQAPSGQVDEGIVAAANADLAPVAEPSLPRKITQPSTMAETPKPPARAAARGKVAMPAMLRRPAFLAGAIGAMAAAAALGFYLKGRGGLPVTSSADGPWSGTVASVSRASADQSGGLEACEGAGACSPLASGATVRAGTTLRTDARTRVHLTLADGTDLAIDRASEVELSRGQARAARLTHGALVADVTHVEGAVARFSFPRGEATVIGTKLAITAGDDRASVEVARGSVRVKNDAGKSVDVRAGEEATLAGDAAPLVSSATTLADVMEWSDNKPEDVDAPVLRGLGELRARKPGQTKEKDHAVRLAKHAVKVRVVDIVARTEVDETFTNDTDEELEGIFRFPLPPGAQIEKLALEVDGKLVDGAFVDRDKGAAIWRGVIQHAAPQAPKPREEIVWVPGPWRDPALLEWQRGGRFELKIFPIPRRGSRRVVIAYTQTVDQSAGIRRFTYPLAHDPSGSTRIGSFDLDLQVLGLDPKLGLSTRGYDLAAGSGERRTMHADDFVPAGDLTVEYALPDRDKDVNAWAYAPPPAVTVVAAPAQGPARPAAGDTGSAGQTASAILDDHSPYVAIALRPVLPRWREAKEHLHVLVVDSSRSMFGERFARATHLASAIVREMDRRDSFMVLACDTTCRPMSADPGSAARPEAPGAAAAGDVERFLGSLEPEGGSDLAAAMAAARTAAGPLGSKELRILYLGDGTPSVGPTRPGHLETAVRSVVPAGDAAVVAVPLGADADTTSLASLARGGGGVVVPYVPGQKISSAALEVLSAAYGVVLRDPEIELPAGLTQVTPSRLDPIRAGGETLLVARMTGGREVTGTLKLRGRVAGERFEQTYPLTVLASESAGNAFVPRLYAAAKIAELERVGGEAEKPTVIELSKRFAVASRYTSLLVLESEAMFKAFGLEKNASAPMFTGEDQAESSTAQAEGDVPREKGDTASDKLTADAKPGPMPLHARGGGGGSLGLSGIGEGGGGRGEGSGRGGPPAPAQAAASPARPSVMKDDFDGPAATAAAPPPPPAKVMGKTVNAEPVGGSHSRNAWSERRRAQGFIPMRRVFDRHVGFDQTNAFMGPSAARLTVAESALAATPDSRDKTVDLFALYATTGRVGEAQALTTKWAARDALDPDALQARADLAARLGDRDRAVRILGGLADLRPNDRTVQTRLADLWDVAGNAALACEHRIALADMALSEPRLVAAAIRCARAQGQSDLAAAIRGDTTDKIRDAVDRILATPAPAAQATRGDVQITGEWTGGADLDVALIDAQGKRTSWMGSSTRATVSARDVNSTRGETLEIAGLPQGNYVLEIARASGRDTGDTARGEITLRLNGEIRRVPFNLTGARAELGTVRVFFTSHLEPLDGPANSGSTGGWRGGVSPVPF
jgi:hypothetical protein